MGFPRYKRANDWSATIKNGTAVIEVLTQQALEAAVLELREQKVESSSLSILQLDRMADAGVYTLGPRLDYWSQVRCSWAELTGNAGGSGRFGIAGLGNLMVSGPATATLVAALEGRLVREGQGPVGAALYHLGVDEARIEDYQNSLKASQILILSDAPK